MPNNDLISRAALINDLSYCAPELFFDKDYLATKIMKQPRRRRYPGGVAD